MSNTKQKNLNERYSRLVEVLTSQVVDPETKQQVLDLIENGFAPFDLATLGKARAQTTWEEFKRTVETLGVSDKDLIASIRVTNMDPRCFEVTQQTDTDAASNIYTITSAEKPIEQP